MTKETKQLFGLTLWLLLAYGLVALVLPALEMLG
jgi:hypothetical protein